MIHTFDICPCPALYPYYHRPNSIVIVVDILRAGTSIVTALAHGAKEILPVATTDEAQSCIGSDCIVAAERNARRCSFARLGNDPEEFSQAVVSGRRVVLTTTNGTQALEAAYNAGAGMIIVGAFNNATAVANYCMRYDRDVVLLASGWKNQYCIEDTLYGGLLIDLLEGFGHSYTLPDGSRVALELYRTHRNHLREYLHSSDHNRRLIQQGYAHSLSLCLEQDTTSVVPVLTPSKSIIAG